MYKHNRKHCWEALTDNVKVTLNHKYVIDDEIFHEIKKMFLAKQPKQKSTGKGDVAGRLYEPINRPEIVDNLIKRLNNTTGKDSGNLPNTKNKAGGLSKSVFNSHYQSRPKPNKIEEIEVRALGGDVEFDVISFSKINKIIQVINYLLEKEK